MCTKKLPVGVDSFEKLRKEEFYYVDKTGLIADIMQNWGRGESLHASAQIRENPEHEHAQILL